jgi:hypothetical protein
MTAQKRRSRTPVTRQLVIRVDLLDAKPPIWRRLELSPDLTLDQVHWVLQVAFEWDNSHLHQFVKGDEREWNSRIFYAPPEFGLESDFTTNDIFLGDVLKVPGDKLTYVYDFGDSWRHGLVLEKVVDRDPDAPAARCLAGRRASPPEDCGGIWQYLYMMAAGFDPNHPGYADAQEWVEWAFGDQPFDPAAFDVDAMDKNLTTMFESA